MATVTARFDEDVTSPVAKLAAAHIVAADFDYVDETDNSEIRYYLSAETDDFDAAHSVVFSGPGPFTWDGWIAPDAGTWTFFLRRVSDDVQIANTEVVYA